MSILVSTYEVLQMKLWKLLLVQLAVVVAVGYGWVMNVIVIVNALQTNANIDAMLIFRILGVPVFPLGAVLGYI